jgi:hypothetical protein
VAGAGDVAGVADVATAGAMAAIEDRSEDQSEFLTGVRTADLSRASPAH